MQTVSPPRALPERWSSALVRHSAAVESYCSTARSIDETTWNAPIADGKWSPAEITEHLNRTYDVTLDQLNGGQGIRVRTNWFVRSMLRATALRWIFRRRALPRGAKAPREVKPDCVVDSRVDAIARMVLLASRFEDLVAERHQDAGLKLTHHIFGEIDLLPAIDFVAIHIEHHHRQIEAVAG